MKLKNDKERLAFLDARTKATGWYLWKYDDDLQREWWGFDLPDATIIVEEQAITYSYPKPHEDKMILHWYIITDWNGLFADQVASRTQALQLIKKCNLFK